MSIGNASLQLAADPAMRGRVMGLWFVAFQGSTPIGGPIAGAFCEYFGARSGLVLGAGACFAAAGLGLLALSSQTRRAALDAPDESPVTEVGLRSGDAVGARGGERAEQPLPASAKAAYISGDVKIAGGPIGLP